MTRREFLQERYEDALFALLMDDVATTEGEKAIAENENLNNNSNISISADLQQKCRKTINRSFSSKRMHNTSHVFSKVVTRIAVIALIGTLLFTTAFAASPSFRAKTLNIMIEVFDEGTAFRATGEQMDISNIEITTNWLPDGFSLADELQNTAVIWKQYQSQAGQLLEINARKLSEGDATAFDTEDAKTEGITIHGYTAMKITKNNCVQIIWTQEDLGVVVEIFGENVEDDITICFAENISILPK